MDPDLVDWIESFEPTGPAAWVFFGLMAVMWFVAIAAYVSIIRKAGYSGWWILVALVPVLNIVMFLVFAFAQWPVQRALRAARSDLARMPGGVPHGGPPPPPWR